MKILTILGARPQFIKAATISRQIKKNSEIEELIVHTGQHYDSKMSDIFFDELEIPRPDYNLGISGLIHGAMTGRMVEGIEEIICSVKPDWVLVYGDTNSTLAGAIAASKLHFPIAHIEAGLRSQNPLMPEEINRILTDRVSSLLLCPTSSAIKNLKNEGFPFKVAYSDERVESQKIVNVGDVMYDAVLHYTKGTLPKSTLNELNLSHGEYILCTIHRQENTDDLVRLKNIVDALWELNKDKPVVVPVHPRAKSRIRVLPNYKKFNELTVIDPLSYREMLSLQRSAKRIITDSGGLQKEAYFNRVPCITIRDQTEWCETVYSGWNKLVGANCDEIVETVLSEFHPNSNSGNLFGNGDAANLILSELSK